ncbi:MAG: hypothetical protein AAFR77_22575, partial [Cyanobacteria bacterium J06631_2]
LMTIRGAILFQDDLNPDRILERLKSYMPLGQVQLDKSQWEKIWQNCTESEKRAEIALKCAESISAQKLINDIQSRTLELDAVQNKLATEIPPGPQRLRGLAGTGKTIILARRAALMHFLHSDWNIVFTFYTTTLTNEIKKLIDLAFREILSENGSQVRSPNWRKIRVIRSWGGKDTEGFYANLARANRSQFRSFDDAQKEINRLRAERTRYQNRAFAYVCDRLEEESPEIEPIYDAVIIDEGQDLPPSFFRLAYHSLTQPKRLYWAYDEAQAVNSLIVPNSESIFGRDEKTNKLRVDLQGQYEGGILKGCIMNRTYRSPRLLIMAAHAINMGLFRQGGVLQGVTTKADWQILGYEVGKNSDFLDTSVREGKHITVTRPNRNSPHEIDRPDFQLQEIVGELIRIRTFKDERQEQEWIAAEVARDINIWGFDPKHILIARVGRDYQDCYSNSLKQILQSNGVAVHHAGVDGNKLNFKQNGCVTIANVHRAKGHEAWKVYVCRFDKADSFPGDKTETVLRKRNEGFTALTRSKAWCVVTGTPSPIFEELETAVAMYPDFSFPAYNKKSLKRVTNDEQGSNDRRARVSKPILRMNRKVN